MPKLVISLPDAGEVIHELTARKVTVGRTEESAIEIADASVSTNHAELVQSGSTYTLSDVGSTNGTRINGEPLAGAHQLQPGDRIRFGKVEAIYEAPGAAQPRPLQQAALATAAANSQRPSDFSNASPFRTKRVKKNPADGVALGAFALAVLAFGASVYFVYSVQAPHF